MQNSIELLKSLNALWYVTTESEDEAGNVTVSKRNILPLVDAQKFQSMDAEELWDDISSFCVDYPIEDSFIGNNEAQAFINARSHLLKQLSVDALICADRTDLIEDDYSDYCRNRLTKKPQKLGASFIRSRSCVRKQIALLLPAFIKQISF